MSRRGDQLAWAETRSVAGSIAHRLSHTEIGRWLGYPRGKRLEGRVLERVDQARDWFSEHGRPFFALRSVGIESVRGQGIYLRSGITLTSESLARRCAESEACALVCVALSAGEGIDVEVEKLWASDRPDEAYILDRLGVAVTELLRLELKARISHQAKIMGFHAQSASGPGYAGWSLADQEELYALIGGRGRAVLPGFLQVLASGMLRPRLSMLLAFPLSASADARMDVGIPCSVCNYVNCSYRKVTRTARPEEVRP